MKRAFAMILLVCLVVFGTAACGQSDASRTEPTSSLSSEQGLEPTDEAKEQETAAAGEKDAEPIAEQEQTEYIPAIPAAYFESAAQQGQVIQVTYESQDYTGDDTPITKPALVYLPYGYGENDADTRYDILYLMPYIESRFHTYAEDVTEEGFEASREHRAFGGFSLGAVTTWYQFIYNLDYIKNFVPMSGDCWIIRTYGGRDYPVETVDYLTDMLAEGGYGEDDFRIYQGIGTDDPIWDQTNNQIQEMFTRSTFTPENLHYAIIEGGRHDMPACERYLYYALQDFFGGEA